MAMSSELPVLKTGDKVRLTGGGAVMSVERVNDQVATPFAQCAWMSKRQVLHRAFIALGVLEPVSADEQQEFNPISSFPEARLAGADNNNNKNNNNNGR